MAAIAEQHRSGSLILDEIICSNLPDGVSFQGENAVELAMVACWYIWWERRQVSHDKEIGTPARSSLQIRGIVANWVAEKTTN